MQLAALDTAQSIEDLDIPGYRLHPLKGSRKGIWSITVNANWRLTFEFSDGNVYILDYEDLMAMYNPPHPGEFIKATYMEPFDLSCRYLAKQLNVTASTLNRVLKKQSDISPEMALRLSKALGRSPESWLAMQDAYDLWQAKRNIELNKVQKVNLDAA